MKERVQKALALALTVSLFVACAAPKQEDNKESREPQTEQTDSTPSDRQDDIREPEGSDSAFHLVAGERPTLLTAQMREETGVTPCVEPYTVASDLSNVENLGQFYFGEGLAAKLAQNGFVVCGGGGSEFFEIYEANRYNQIPNFVTVDSMMHTYHLYFAYLLKNIERSYLSDSLAQLSKRMLAASIAQYEALEGTEWEHAAKRNVAFFTVGAKLLDDSTVVEDYVADIVNYELDHINSAEGIDVSEISEIYEDYSQYVPRGYYEGDEKLEQYFRAMMWYGRMHFLQDNEDMDRSALLMTRAVAGDSEAYALWESIYAVTSFFAGASDDSGVCEYAPLIVEAYGDASTKDLIGNEEAFADFHARTAALAPPQINSIPIADGTDNVISGFRFMGQRFTIDAAIMQRLIDSNVEDRMLPDVLDVPAALGSDTALQILEENGSTAYAGYMDNMNLLREALGQENPELWSASLYAGWLHTLRPLLTVKGEGYPMFMQSEEWLKKDLECFAGSFTELKHDTVLYAKQVMAEMGGGEDMEIIDFRGYVEPEPEVYARFADLADATRQGLKTYNMLTADDEENLKRLSEMAERLKEISNKELLDETLTDEEYRFIEDYGGNLEHFWYESVKDSGDYVFPDEYPSALVVDIATDPNGSVLEVATGNPSQIYVVVKVDGKLRIATGSVYSFYQFTWSDRLTDTKWRIMMGFQVNEEGYYNQDAPIERPDWTGSYRYKYDWE
ncbi:MAG: DUF3160 domain-containing protein [Lachnospiraceae bacterium]|nr:DUF3160 domain-containing protein [Lachnospiraceae bacterium]